MSNHEQFDGLPPDDSVALRTRLQQFEALVDSLWDAVYIVNAEGRITFCNHSLLRLTGYRRKALLGRPSLTLYPPEIAATFHERRRQAWQGETPPPHLETMLVRQDGAQVPVELTVSNFCRNGHLIGRLAVLRDLTASKRAEAEWRQFTRVVSHDLQEPLRMIASYAQLLAARYRGKLDATADAFIGYMVDGASSMQDMIRDLLTYARVDLRSATFASVDCTTSLQQALTNLRLAVAESGATITYDILPTVQADATQLTQLWQNLLGNAIKYRSATPPQVHVSAVSQHALWRFAVRDNGIGIAPQDADRIFEMFRRLHTRDAYEGSGIGLALCKRIVERHGGRIWVESQPGQGATFYFTLPRRSALDGRWASPSF